MVKFALQASRTYSPLQLLGDSSIKSHNIDFLYIYTDIAKVLSYYKNLLTLILKTVNYPGVTIVDAVNLK